MLDYKRMYQRTGELFKELKSETRPRDLVMQMAGEQRQAVAIARTRLSQWKLVLMAIGIGAGLLTGLLAGVNPFGQGTFVGLFIILAVLLERVRGRQSQRTYAGNS